MFIINKFEEKVINLVKQIEERHLAIYITKRSISTKIIMKDYFQKVCHKKKFLSTLVF